MVKPFPSKTHIGNHTLYPETPMLNYGYDPQLSEGASRAELARDCLRDLRMWPECESVVFGQCVARAARSISRTR